MSRRSSQVKSSYRKSQFRQSVWDDTNELMEGSLEKMTRHGKWVSRYFVLKGHYLVYHDEKHKESIETRAPKGAVDLDQVQVIEIERSQLTLIVAPAESEQSEKNTTKIQLRASDSETARRWERALGGVIHPTSTPRDVHLSQPPVQYDPNSADEVQQLASATISRFLSKTVIPKKRRNRRRMRKGRSVVKDRQTRVQSMYEGDLAMEGYLKKRSTGLHRQWQTRYFTLRGHYLKVFLDDQKQDIKATLEISHVRVVRLHRKGKRRGSWYGSMITLYMGDIKQTTYQLMAANDAEARTWAKALLTVHGSNGVGSVRLKNELFENQERSGSNEQVNAVYARNNQRSFEAATDETYRQVTIRLKELDITARSIAFVAQQQSLSILLRTLKIQHHESRISRVGTSLEGLLEAIEFDVMNDCSSLVEDLVDVCEVPTMDAYLLVEALQMVLQAEENDGKAELLLFQRSAAKSTSTNEPAAESAQPSLQHIMHSLELSAYAPVLQSQPYSWTSWSRLAQAYAEAAYDTMHKLSQTGMITQERSRLRGALEQQTKRREQRVQMQSLPVTLPTPAQEPLPTQITSSSSGTELEEVEFEAKLRQFYKERNPEKLAQPDALRDIIHSYSGDVSSLNYELRKQYGCDLGSVDFESRKADASSTNSSSTNPRRAKASKPMNTNAGELERLESELYQFYQVYNPRKLSEVGAIKTLAEDHVGKMALLNRELRRQYGCDLDSMHTQNSSPSVYERREMPRDVPDEDIEDLRIRLQEFYRVYNPSKLSEPDGVDSVVREFSPDPRRLNRELRRQYGCDLDSMHTQNSSPSVYERREMPRDVPDEDIEDLRIRLQEFYRVYNPSKLSEPDGVDSVVREFSPDPRRLNRELRRQYGCDLDSFDKRNTPRAQMVNSRYDADHNEEVQSRRENNLTTIKPVEVVSHSGIENFGFEAENSLLENSAHCYRSTKVEQEQGYTTAWIIYDLLATFTVTALEWVNDCNGCGVKHAALMCSSGRSGPWSNVAELHMRNGTTRRTKQTLSGFSGTGRYWKVLMKDNYGVIQPFSGRYHVWYVGFLGNATATRESKAIRSNSIFSSKKSNVNVKRNNTPSSEKEGWFGRERSTSVEKLQAAKNAKRAWRNRTLTANESRALLMIQKASRMYLFRLRIDKSMIWKWEERSAITLQAFSRGVRDRASIENYKRAGSQDDIFAAQNFTFADWQRYQRMSESDKGKFKKRKEKERYTSRMKDIKKRERKEERKERMASPQKRSSIFSGLWAKKEGTMARKKEQRHVPDKNQNARATERRPEKDVPFSQYDRPQDNRKDVPFSQYDRPQDNRKDVPFSQYDRPQDNRKDVPFSQYAAPPNDYSGRLRF